MPTTSQNLVILGSTGSIGRSTLDVVHASPERFNVIGLSANKNLNLLCQQAKAFRPRWVVATSVPDADRFDWRQLPSDVRLIVGPEGIEDQVASPDVDIVVAAIVGSAGLRGTWRAIQAGKTVALANKETLVMAGQQVMQLARDSKSNIIPVDSEHSAVFQAMRAGNDNEVQRIILTASGGPFRCYSREQLQNVTVQDALAHPTWDMGQKITIDSATMMNKALEVIEARWLFDLPPEKIEVLIHPQSVVHSMVEFVDGSVVAQLSPPDMRLPIQYALTWPERTAGPTTKLDITRSFCLEFEPPSPDRFPALPLGYQVARDGGTAGSVLNAANEAAVAGFLAGKLKFSDVVAVCRTIVENHAFDAHPTLDELIKIDGWARQEVTKWIGSC